MKTIKKLSLILCLVTGFSCGSVIMQKANGQTQGQDTLSAGIPDLIDVREEYDLLAQYPAPSVGDSAFSAYLKTHVKYPKEAKDKNVSGKVFAAFIVEKDGSISHLEILRGIGYGCDEEVLKALENMPVWNPGRIGKNAVRVKLVIPVEFNKD